MSLFRSEVLTERAQPHWGSVIVTQAPGLRRSSIALLMAFGIGAGLILSLDYSRKVRVAGYLEPAGGIAEVLAPVAGQVAALHVREGSRVRRGQALLALDLGRLDEHGNPMHVLEAKHLAASIARLDELAAAEVARHETGLQAAREELAHLEEERRELGEELRVVEERAALLHRAEKRLGRLLRRGLVARAEVERQQQQTLAARQSESQLRRALTGNVARAQAQRLALARLDGDFRVRQLRAAQERSGLERRLEQALGEYGTTIVAPRDGVAAFLQFVPGDRVTRGQVLMTIAPTVATTELVLLAGPAAADRIGVGNEVRFRVPGDRKDGEPIGVAVVREISRTPQKPYRLNSWIAVNEPVFRARADVIDYPENLGLRHGVHVEAFVVTTSKALWRWLLGPLASALAAL